MVVTYPRCYQVVDEREGGRIFETEKYVGICELIDYLELIARTMGHVLDLSVNAIIENYLIPYDSVRPQLLRFVSKEVEPRFRIGDHRYELSHPRTYSIALPEPFTKRVMRAVAGNCFAFVATDRGTKGAKLFAVRSSRPRGRGKTRLVPLDELPNNV